MLAGAGYRVRVFYLAFSSKTSKDWAINRDILVKQDKAEYNEIREIGDFPLIRPDDIIIDSIFGSGLTRPAEGLPAKVISKINDAEARVVSVDIPSGLFGEVL